MAPSCRPGILLLCLAAGSLMGCAGGTTVRTDWEKDVQRRLVEGKANFQACGKHLARPAGGQDVALHITFRVNPSGSLETMWLDESGQWDQRFYDCVFNVVDNMRFPAIDDETSLEVRQVLVYKARKTR